MKILCGVDIVEIERIKRILEEHGQSFKDRVYTVLEAEYCEKSNAAKYKSYAARFAAKEAVSKALGTGIAGGISLREIEVQNNTSGKPRVVLYGKARELYDSLSAISMDISLSHCDNYAVAYVSIISDQNA
jgi:holo-[acyl-carrier protein] synthase